MLEKPLILFKKVQFGRFFIGKRLDKIYKLILLQQF